MLPLRRKLPLEDGEPIPKDVLVSQEPLVSITI